MFKKFNHKAATAALGVTAMLASFAVAAPMPAAAQGGHYDGYCYVKKEDLAGKDAAIGAIGGGIAGVLLGGKHDKGKDALIGAAVGGTAGYVVGKNSHQKLRCADHRYYVYDHGYYAPPPAQHGYKEVYFEERPEGFDNYVVDRHGRAQRYHGH